MDKKIAGLVGAISALGAVTAAQAAVAPAPSPLEASSFEDLLKPIPNALALLQTADASQAGSTTEPVRPAGEQVAQYHHHHHHHWWWRRRYYHHHHHHHYY